MRSWTARCFSVLLLAGMQIGASHAASESPLPSPVLDRIHSRGELQCGVVKEEEDYSRAEDHGNRAAFDLDLCRAVAVAVLGPEGRVVVHTFPDELFALRALRAGELDLVATASLTMANSASGFQFAAPILMDGQGMLVHATGQARRAADLAGKRVCFLTGSQAEDGLHRYADAHHLRYVWYPFSEAGEMEAAFFTGNCDALTGDMTQLANVRAIDPRRAGSFALLPDTLREDPLATATAAGDPRFSAAVFWTEELLLRAEAAGVSRAMAGSPEGDRSLQVPQGRFGAAKALGLREGWADAVLKAVGNYGELFERDLGGSSALRMPRDKNRPVAEGGTLLALPLSEPQ